MKQRLKRLLVRLLSLLPGKPVILLESAPPLGDNTGALYRTLLAQGWNARYRLVWVVPDPAAFRNVHEKNGSFAGTRGTWALLRLFWLRARAAAIVDCNGVQINGWVNEIMTVEPLADKWRAFGWNVVEVNGHNMKDLLTVLHTAKTMRHPTVILMRTVKGRGVSFMEDDCKWHGNSPSDEELVQAILEIGEGGVV